MKQEVARVGMRLGRYLLQRELGEGGMASVFEAHDTKLDRQVAVKVMFPHLARRQEAVARFKREARAAAGLDHEHIVRVFDVGGSEIENGHLVPPYIVLELIDGQSLSDFYSEHEAPLAEIVAAIGVVLCRALSLAHDKQIVHRDIKPANVMVTREGRVALADFGVAHIGDEDSVVTRTGAILGTPSFMAPEQASAEGVDSRVDIYSLGATLYAIATGSLPYSGTPAQVLAAVLDGKRVPAEQREPKVGRELSRIIEELMHLDPQERIQTAQEAEVALLAVVQGGGFEDVESLLSEYFQHPKEGQRARTKLVISKSLVRARLMSEAGRVPLALAMVERVQALDRTNLQAQTLAEKFGRQGPKRMWPAIVLPMVVTAGVGILMWGNQPGSIALYLSDAGAADAALSLDASQPDAAVAQVMRDAAPKQERPTQEPHQQKPSARTRFDAAQALAPEDAQQPIQLQPVKPAKLIVDIKPWCDVWIDGKEFGRASATKEIEVRPGTHQVQCRQSSTGKKWVQSVDLASGQLRRLEGSLLEDIQIQVRLSKDLRIRFDNQSTFKSGQAFGAQAGRHGVELLEATGEIRKSLFLDLRQDCEVRDQPRLGCFAN